MDTANNASGCAHRKKKFASSACDSVDSSLESAISFENAESPLLLETQFRISSTVSGSRLASCERRLRSAQCPHSQLSASRLRNQLDSQPRAASFTASFHASSAAGCGRTRCAARSVQFTLQQTAQPRHEKRKKEKSIRN